MDLDGTLRACQSLHNSVPRLIEQETNFVREHQIRLILGDIPPLCFEIAMRASVDSVAIANFTWSEIYGAYIKNYPGFKPLIKEMEGFYRNATLALTLPYPCGMDVFPRQEPIPWIARRSALTKEEARKAFRLPQFATLVLLSFGGLGLERFPWGNLKSIRELFFVTTGENKQETNNLRVLPEAQRNYADLVRAVDVIVTKPGYGIVADIISHQVPTLYTDRGDFAEYRYLVQALEDSATVEFIPQQQLLVRESRPVLDPPVGQKETLANGASRRCRSGSGEDFALDRSLNLSRNPVLTVLYQSTRLEAYLWLYAKSSSHSRAVTVPAWRWPSRLWNEHFSDTAHRFTCSMKSFTTSM